MPRDVCAVEEPTEREPIAGPLDLLLGPVARAQNDPMSCGGILSSEWWPTYADLYPVPLARLEGPL
jgi:hypothetical protein